MVDEIYSEHGGRTGHGVSAGVLRGSSADLPRILRGAGKPIWGKMENS